MTDLLVLVGCLTPVCVIVAAVLGYLRTADTMQQRRHDSLALAEQWAAWFLERYPRATDEQIATLMRDELANRRMASWANVRAANAGTVGRVRRNMGRVMCGE